MKSQSRHRVVLPRPPAQYDPGDQAHLRAALEQASALWQPKTIYLGTRARQLEEEIADGRINLRNYAPGEGETGWGGRLQDALTKMRTDGTPIFAPEGTSVFDAPVGTNAHGFGTRTGGEYFAMHGAPRAGATVIQYNSGGGDNFGRFVNFAGVDLRDLTFDGAAMTSNSGLAFVGNSAQASTNVELHRVRVLDTYSTPFLFNGGIYQGRIVDCYAYGGRHGYTLAFSAKDSGGNNQNAIYPEHFQIEGFRGHNCYGSTLNVAGGYRVLATNLYGVWDDAVSDYPSNYALIRFGNGAHHCGVSGFYGNGLYRGVRFADTHYCWAANGLLVGMLGPAVLFTEKDQKARTSSAWNILCVDPNRIIGYSRPQPSVEDDGDDDGDVSGVNNSCGVLLSDGHEWVLSGITIDSDTLIDGNGVLDCTADNTTVTVTNNNVKGKTVPCLDRYNPGLDAGTQKDHGLLFDRSGNFIGQISSLGTKTANTPSAGYYTQTATLTTGGALVTQTRTTRTGTVTTSGTALTGVGTLFLTELNVGDYIYRDSDNALVGVVNTITDNTNVVLKASALNAIAGAAYKSLAGKWYVRYPNRYFFASRNGVLTSNSGSPTVTAGAYATFSDIALAVSPGLLLFKASDHTLIGQASSVSTTYTPKTGNVSVDITQTQKVGNITIDISVDATLVTGTSGTQFLTDIADGDAIYGGKGRFVGIVAPGSRVSDMQLRIVTPATQSVFGTKLFTGPNPYRVTGTGTTWLTGDPTNDRVVAGDTIYKNAGSVEIGTVSSVISDTELYLTDISNTTASPAAAYKVGVGSITLTRNARQTISPGAAYEVGILKKTAYGFQQASPSKRLHFDPLTCQSVGHSIGPYSLAGTVANPDIPIGTLGANLDLNATGVGFYGTGAVAKPSVSGALSSVTDANAKAVLTSIIAALGNVNLASNGTT